MHRSPSTKIGVPEKDSPRGSYGALSTTPSAIASGLEVKDRSSADSKLRSRKRSSPRSSLASLAAPSRAIHRDFSAGPRSEFDGGTIDEAGLASASPCLAKVDHRAARSPRARTTFAGGDASLMHGRPPEARNQREMTSTPVAARRTTSTS